MRLDLATTMNRRAAPDAAPAAEATHAAAVSAGLHFDAVIVGAGFAGLYMLHRARALGLSVCLLEAGAGLGGVWYWNRYPGARCDVESMQYSYGFSEALQQEWTWSERFASQPEILAYAQHVAARFDLWRDIRFDRRVTAARFVEAADADTTTGLTGPHWLIDTRSDSGNNSDSDNDNNSANNGASGERLSARFCIMATGCLSSARLPQWPGLDGFTGKTYHTGHWPHEGVDFTGQRVGVIGTGSSGIQLIPRLAAQAEQLVVFQRTPNFSVPARNAPMDTVYERSWKDDYAQLRQRARDHTTSGTLYETSTRRAHETPPAEREQEYARRWQHGGVNFMHSFNDLMLDARSNETAAEFVRGQIRATVTDPAVAALLTPTGYPIGAKRICVDSGYFATFNRANVTLVDVRAAPIEAVTPTGLQTRGADGGAHYELDAIVFATGYDAMTGALLKIDITGRDGATLAQCWSEGPKSYLGLGIAGFPNLFTITGPGSPAVLANMVFAIEQHVDWIATCLAHMRDRGVACIEAQPQAQADWAAHVSAAAAKTLFVQANSWYLSPKVSDQPRVFMPYAGGVIAYRDKCLAVVANGYEGFHFSAPTASFS